MLHFLNVSIDSFQIKAQETSEYLPCWSLQTTIHYNGCHIDYVSVVSKCMPKEKSNEVSNTDRFHEKGPLDSKGSVYTHLSCTLPLYCHMCLVSLIYIPRYLRFFFASLHLVTAVSYTVGNLLQGIMGHVTDL